MQADCSDILSELESWYARENGQYLLQETRNALSDVLDTSFGYHILQVGVSGGRPLCADSPINHRIYCTERLTAGANLLASPDEIPLDSDSVDTVIVHHCLEFAANPHQVLREVQRVLTPQGQLLVVAFNPYSLLGAKAYVRRMLRDPLWRRYRPVSESRLSDWLHLLGCEVVGTRRLYGLPPAGRGRLRDYLTRGDRWIARHNLPAGGVYILHGTKQVAGLHPSRRSRFSRGGRLIGLVPKPAASPTPTPSSPATRNCSPFEKGDVAA